jgi:RHS repeat-associated protein
LVILTRCPLSRLRQANYNDGRQFDYTYDAVGNRLTQTVDLGQGNPVVTNYQYDTANRLEYVNDQAYTWDNNGNLLNDGASGYTYDHADRLKSASEAGLIASYNYNGMGNRLQQTVSGATSNYTLDLAGGLTQVLGDGTQTYLYGNGRIAQYTETTPEYFLGDALGSVRQLVDGSGNVAMAKEYEPYGEVMNSAGTTSTSYGFTSEWTDYTGLIYLRARYYDPTMSRFMTRDSWGGDMNQPMSFNAWLYTVANPINLVDPYGNYSITISGNWLNSDVTEIYHGVSAVATALTRAANFITGKSYSSEYIFSGVFGQVNFQYLDQSTWVDQNQNGIKDYGEYYYCARLTEASGYPSGVGCYRESRGNITPHLISHEMGHVFNGVIVNKTISGEIPENTVSPYKALSNEGIYAVPYSNRLSCYNVKQIAGIVNGEYLRTNYGYLPNTRENTSALAGEDFADMFANWVMAHSGYIGGFTNDAYGIARHDWMDWHIYYWLDVLLGLPVNLPYLSWR